MEKPWLVFVHGMFCHRGVWDPMVAYFEERGYECLALDLPYHDKPPYVEPDPRLGTTSIRDYSNFLEKVLAGINRPFVLIGHSMGGLIVMKTAGLAHVNPRSIVLLAPAAPNWLVGMAPSTIKAFGEIIGKWGFWQMPVMMGLDVLEQSMLNKVPADCRYQIAVGLKHESGRAGFEMGFWFFDRHCATSINPSGITCPVSILVGTQDLITHPLVVTNIARQLAGIGPLRRFWLSAQEFFGRQVKVDLKHVELIYLLDKGHWLPTEADYALIERLLEKG